MSGVCMWVARVRVRVRVRERIRVRVRVRVRVHLVRGVYVGGGRVAEVGFVRGVEHGEARALGVQLHLRLPRQLPVLGWLVD